MLYSISWTDFILWLPLLLEILDILFLVFICFPVCEVINFEFNFFYQAIFLHNQKIQNKNLNIFRTKEAFKIKFKVFFYQFKGLSVVRNCLRSESESLRKAISFHRSQIFLVICSSKFRENYVLFHLLIFPNE